MRSTQMLDNPEEQQLGCDETESGTKGMQFDPGLQQESLAKIIWHCF
jgi:hypothetical protein